MTFRERINMEAQAAKARKKLVEEKNKPQTKPEESDKEKPEPDKT